MARANENNRIVKVSDAQASGTSAFNSATVDCQDYDNVLFLAAFGTGAANNTVKMQSGALSDASDAADVTGATIASGTSKNVWLEGTRVGRYARIVFARGTASTIENVWAILYNGSKLPAVNAGLATLDGKAV